MSDTITNISEVKNAIANVEKQVSKLKDYPNEINSIKEQISEAWQSTKATEYITKLGTINDAVSNAITSLNNYVSNVKYVVTQLEHFDNTITYDSQDTSNGK